jgi:hypothetical protein
VVLVAPNYRLQALGFMALKQLALDNGPDGSEGNYGLWDQLIALQWIRRNIDSFGGDPSNVLLFGPDSASALPLALISRKRRNGNGGGGGDDDDGGGSSSSNYSSSEELEHQRRRQQQLEPQACSAGAQRGPADQARAASKPEACRKNNSDDDYEQLFHSVWLMNPTIYYELPYELANQHYSRLIRSQSVCSSELGGQTSAAGAESSSEAARSSSSPPSATVNEATNGSGRRHMATRVAEWRETRRRLREQSPANGSAQRLLDCLVGLPAEQVVREYLGRDDAAFRLDDENSLPIRNIFPDQFVTLDGQLVRDSFPFLRLSVQAAGEQEVLAAMASGGADGQRRQQTALAGYKLLVGSTAQAVAFWPCPRNLRDWSWQDFRHYVATSLNSFNQADGTFERASELYRLPAAGGGGGGDDCHGTPASCPAASPMEAYLTMVSDIRQVCPAHELARSLAASGRVGSLERYIVEWRPSERLARSMGAGMGAGMGTANDPNSSGNNNTDHLKYAFHYWDLLALFGFEFDPALEPDQADLEFQRQVRAMAKRFVWSPIKAGQEPAVKLGAGADATGRAREPPSDGGDDGVASEPRRRGSNERLTIFTLDNQVRSVVGGANIDGQPYKGRECKMWQQSLKQSYAWIS